MAILKHIVSKSSNYGAALEYLIFKHDELRKTPILDQNGNRIMRDEFYLDGLNCEPYSFDAACQQLNRECQKNKNKNEIKSHHYIISFDPRDSTENCSFPDFSLCGVSSSDGKVAANPVQLCSCSADALHLRLRHLHCLPSDLESVLYPAGGRVHLLHPLFRCNCHHRGHRAFQ